MTHVMSQGWMYENDFYGQLASCIHLASRISGAADSQSNVKIDTVPRSLAVLSHVDSLKRISRSIAANKWTKMR